jgi:hypothetical protein
MRTFGQFGHRLFLLYLFTLSQGSFAIIVDPKFPQNGLVSPDNRGEIDPSINYENFSGRVSDKDDSGSILKINVENNNTKFFRAGDLVKFKVNLKENTKFCEGNVRNVEDFHFTIYVESLDPCFERGKYFKRGTVLNFTSRTLGLRVFEASKYREQLILRKEDFLKQLNDINHFLWTFDQQKVQVSMKYDEEINRLQREKRKALDDMISLKHEKLILQNELMSRLTDMDGNLKFYRVERQELMTDRWNLDHDAGLPVGQRPQTPKLR